MLYRLRWLLKSYKDTNHQVSIIFQQNWLKQLALRSTNVLILFGIRRNCLRSWRSRSLYLFIRRAIKQMSNYRCNTVLLSTYKILSNMLLSRLIPYAEEIIGDHDCGFWRNRSTTDHIFCFRHILEKKWEYNETVLQLFIDFKKASESVWREVLNNILI